MSYQQLHIGVKLVLLLTLVIVLHGEICSDPCYKPQANQNCQNDNLTPNNSPVTLHMTVHPHLDAFWIFDFDSYYDPPRSRGKIWVYFGSNHFSTVKDIFTTATDTLNKSKQFRQTYGEVHEKARRTFVNSQMGFFKRWYGQQNNQTKTTVKELLKTKYWEVLGGGFVENDEAGAYYDDIIDNYQLGSHFLQEEFGYLPKVAISADSFGHSQSMAALLTHFGIEGFLVERSDEHILNKEKLEFIWKARSANNLYYGSIPTHIRWSIHGYEEQFIKQNNALSPICQTKGRHLERMRNENKFLRKLFQQNHILRYFGHDFQKFDDYSYRVIEEFMRQFSKEKCNKVVATYTNPTQYFKILFKEVFEKRIHPIATRSEDIFPIWDFDSGLYWTGYFTTDPYHKKIYRDSGRFVQIIRKLFLPRYLLEPKADEIVRQYQQIQRLEEQVAYLQHHDGITCTSKYSVLDGYQDNVEKMQKALTQSLIKDAFNEEFPFKSNQTVFECYLDRDCVVPHNSPPETFVLNIFNSGGLREDLIKIHLPANVYYSSPNAQIETVCLCYILPCNCTMYIYNKLSTYSSFIFRKENAKPEKIFTLNEHTQNSMLTYNKSHITLSVEQKSYHISYKKVVAEGTPRSYEHLNAQGVRNRKSFTIKSGKYAMGNNPNKISQWSSVKHISVVTTDRLIIYIVEWSRAGMTTLITIHKSDLKTWKLDTLSAAASYKLADYFLVVSTAIKNGGVFFTDSNGWLVMKREMFKHEDYEAFFSKEHYDDIDGNTYPLTAFAYIEDQFDKVSINTDRPQGCIGYQQGSIWINFDRLSSDDGKWVWESTYRSEYQKFTHYVSVQNNNGRERRLQTLYDNGLYLQAKAVSSSYANQRSSQTDFKMREKWATISNIDNIKFNVRVWNDSTLLLRIHNLHDTKIVNLSLFATNISIFLTSFYGRELAFDEIYETTLLGNQRYDKFLQNKWNWNKLVNLTEQNQILNKLFAENITMRPLELRAFNIVKPRFIDKYIDPNSLRYTGTFINQTLSVNKQNVHVDSNPVVQNSLNYLLNENHCDSINKPQTQFIPLKQQYKNNAEHVQQKQLTQSAQNTSTQNKIHQSTTPISPAPTNPIIPKTINFQITKVNNEIESFKVLKKMVDNQVTLTPAQKKIYFTYRLKQLRNQINTC